MKLLLDTHTFLWWDGQKDKLTPSTLTLCQDETNDLFLSMVSIWEIQIKVQLKKLILRIPLPDIILHQQQTNQLQILPITLEHIFALETLPHHHRDPFDRLIIAQSMVENLPIITVDSTFKMYPIETLWYNLPTAIANE